MVIASSDPLGSRGPGDRCGRLITLVAAAALLLTGCTVGEPRPPEHRADGAPYAVGLVNLWRVTGVAEEEPDTWLRLETSGFQLWRDCGMINGSWQASDTQFVAGTWGSTGSCSQAEMTVPWLESITSYRADGEGWQLVDADGGVVAALTIDGAPAPIADAVESLAEPPPVTARTREVLRLPTELPADLEPATTEQLLGRWEPAGYAGALEPFFTFTADHAWTGSDGCNGSNGRWAADDAGLLLPTSGFSTAMGCDYVEVPFFNAGSYLVGLDGEQLVVLDADATELGRFERG